MKLKLFLIPFIIFLQVGGCEDDDSSSSSSGSTVTFMGETVSAQGGCNTQSTSGGFITCSYVGGFTVDGVSYGVSVSHTDVCRTATFNMTDNTNDGNALFFISTSNSGGGFFTGATGTVNVEDSGTNSSIRFDGTVTSSETGSSLAISGFIGCSN
jgi:hypothetical protein